MTTMTSLPPPMGESLPVPSPDVKYLMWADYLVFGLSLAVYIVIGIAQNFCGRKTATARQFLNATGEMPVWPVALSMLSGQLSAVLILGTPAEVYVLGSSYWLYCWGMSLGAVLAAIIFVPLLFPLKITTSFQYLEMRFKSKTVKICGTIMLLVGQVMYMGVCVYSPATALQAVTGFSEDLSIVIGFAVAAIYSVLGGMKGSVWVGCTQAIFMMFGTFVAIIKPCIDTPGGIKTIWQANRDTGRFDIWNFDPNPTVRHSWFALVIGGAINWASLYGPNMASFQRFCAVPTVKQARTAVLLNVVGLPVFFTLSVMSGITVFGWYYTVGCDPYEAGYVSSSNEILAFYIMDRVGYPCIGGLFFGSIFAGALSSVVGSMGGIAAVIWEDYLKWKYHYLSNRDQTIISKVIMVCLAGIAIGTAFMCKYLGGPVTQMALSFTGCAGGPMIGLFLLGGLFPCAEWIGASVGSMVALGLSLWLMMGSYAAGISQFPLPTTTENCVNFTAINDTTTPKYPDTVEGIDKFYSLSYCYYAAFGMGVTVVLGLTISTLVGCKDPVESEPRLCIPLLDRMLCCLPARTRWVMRFKWDMDEIDIKVPITQDMADKADSMEEDFGKTNDGFEDDISYSSTMKEKGSSQTEKYFMKKSDIIIDKKEGISSGKELEHEILESTVM